MKEQTLLNRFAFLHSLSTVTRYSRDDVLIPESVLSHLGWATLFAALMAEDIGRFREIDTVKTVLGAAFHDIEESVVADVARPTKYSSRDMTKLFQKLEEKAAGSISQSLDSLQAFRHWYSAKDHTVEGLIVTMADASAVVYKIWYEVAKLGNLSFIRVAEEIKDEGLALKEEIYPNNNPKRWPLLNKWKLEQVEADYFCELLQNLRHVVLDCIGFGTPLTKRSTMRIRVDGKDRY